VLWILISIRIRICLDPHHFGDLDPHPATTSNKNPNPDPRQSDKLDLEPNPDPHQFADDKPKRTGMEYEPI
jgi:hypothetical protein